MQVCEKRGALVSILRILDAMRMEICKAYQHNNEIMCSFDACPLFTNVPLDETIEISLTKLYSLPDPPSLPRHVLKDLLLFATKKTTSFLMVIITIKSMRRYGVSTRSSISELFHV